MRPRAPDDGYVSIGLGVRTKTQRYCLTDEAPITDADELRALIAEGQERGFLTFEQISTRLEEVEVTKEQVQELHDYLEEQGIDVVAADGAAGHVGERARSRPRRPRGSGRGPTSPRSPRST